MGCRLQVQHDRVVRVPHLSWQRRTGPQLPFENMIGADDLRRLDVALKYLLFESAPQADGQLINNVVARMAYANPDATRLTPVFAGNRFVLYQINGPQMAGAPKSRD